MFKTVKQRLLGLVALMLMALSFAAPQASAGVEARIDLTHQRMTVYVNGSYYATWKVSTARRGYVTPRGTFRPRLLKRMHYSKKYHNSPMPHSVFFLGGYAIHGTGAISRLGRPASHGCVRLHPANAATFFSLIKRYGMRNTRIRISGTPRYSAWPAASRRKWKNRKILKKRKHRYRQKINLSQRHKARKYRIVRRNGHGYLAPPEIYGGIIETLGSVYD